MKYVLLIFQNPGAFEALPEDERERLMAEFGAFNKEIEESGEFVGGSARAHPDTAKTVRGRDGVAVTTDGPFAEAKEQLGGFWVIKVPDLDAALAWAAKATVACRNPVEVRPFQDDAED